VTGSIKVRYTNYYFSENGCLYTVSEGLNMRNESASAEELKAIMDTVKIKKLSAEELAKKQQDQETAGKQDVEICGLKYTLDSNFECAREYEHEKTFHHKKKDMFIEISCNDEYNGDFDDYFQKEVNSICFMNGLDSVYSHRIILDNGDRFEVIDYINKSASEAYSRTMKSSVYYYEQDSEMFEFTVGYPEEEEEAAIKYLSNMLSSRTAQ
jgi:hypothetical protein